MTRLRVIDVLLGLTHAAPPKGSIIAREQSAVRAIRRYADAIRVAGHGGEARHDEHVTRAIFSQVADHGLLARLPASPVSLTFEHVPERYEGIQ
jgi:hypothetical protein